MTRIKRDSIAYLFIIVFCILMITWGIPTYTPEYPGYGASAALVPYVSVGLMMVMAFISLLRIVISQLMNKPISADESEFPEDMGESAGFTQVGRVKLYHLASTMMPCVLLVFAIEFITYIFASFLFLLVFQYVIGCRKWFQLTVVSITLTSVLYVVMRYGFSVPVPGPQIF